MSFKPVNRVTKYGKVSYTKNQNKYTVNQYHINQYPIYYKDITGSFHDIDYTYSQSLNNSKVGNFVIYSKDISSIGIRKDGNSTKYIGFRPDDIQESGSHQMEWSIENININNTNINPNLSEYSESINDMGVLVNLGNVKILNSRENKRQMVHYTGSIDDFTIKYNLDLKGLEIENTKYTSNQTLRSKFSASIIDCGTISPNDYNSQISLQTISQSVLSMYIDGDLFSINVSASNEFYDTSSYTLINRDADFWGTDGFMDGASSGYHGNGLWMRFVDDNTALYTARKLEKILNIELEKNIDETDDTIYFRNKTGDKGKVGGWGRLHHGKNSYIGISLNNFSHLSSSFVSKSFDDVSYVTMSYSNVISNLQNNLQSFNAVTASTDHYWPYTQNNNFTIKYNDRPWYEINKPVLLDSTIWPISTETIHTLKDNGDGSYEYIKYPNLKLIANGISSSIENIDVDIQHSANADQGEGQEANTWLRLARRATVCDSMVASSAWNTTALVGSSNSYSAPKFFFCFMPEQLINMADGSKKPIGSINIGEEVEVFDEETMSVKIAPVKKINIKEHDDVYKLHIGNKILKPTGNHPFLTKNKGWTTIDGHNPNHAGGKGYLKVGDFVYDINDGWIEVTKIEVVEGSYDTYNFIDMDYGTIIADDIVTHNSGTNTKRLARVFHRFNTSGVTGNVTIAKMRQYINSREESGTADGYKYMYYVKSTATGSMGQAWKTHDWNLVVSNSDGMYHHGNEDGQHLEVTQNVDHTLRAAARTDIQNQDIFYIVGVGGNDANNSASHAAPSGNTNQAGSYVRLKGSGATSDDPTLIVTEGEAEVVSTQAGLESENSEIIIEGSTFTIE